MNAVCRIIQINQHQPKLLIIESPVPYPATSSKRCRHFSRSSQAPLGRCRSTSPTSRPNPQSTRASPFSTTACTQIYQQQLLVRCSPSGVWYRPGLFVRAYENGHRRPCTRHAPGSPRVADSHKPKRLSRRFPVSPPPLLGCRGGAAQPGPVSNGRLPGSSNSGGEFSHLRRRKCRSEAKFHTK